MHLELSQAGITEAQMFQNAGTEDHTLSQGNLRFKRKLF